MSHVFDPQELHGIVRKSVGLPHEEMMRTLVADLTSAYPGHVEQREDWIFSLTAGAVGVMNVLYASLSEYLIVYGTPIGTAAFSGRYVIDVYDYILCGDMWTYS